MSDFRLTQAATTTVLIPFILFFFFFSFVKSVREVIYKVKLTVNCDKPDVCEIEKEQIPESYFHEKKDPFDLMSFYMHFIVKGFYETSYFWRKKRVLCCVAFLIFLC